ncbi:hypothetical protein JCM8547_002840 [Rhodosporidiobolus lusitaniae]
MTQQSEQSTTQPPALTPQLSLDLRLRFLEHLLRPTPSSSAPSQTAHVPLARRVALVNQQLTAALAGQGSGAAHGGGGATAGAAPGASEAVRRFVQNYDLNAPLLSVAPVPLLAGSSSADVTPQAKVSLILEAENEIRALEKELREIAVLDERGVVGAGKLGEHEALKPQLVQLRQATGPVASSYTSLEQRTTALLQQYNDYISTLSELFVSWNDILAEAENAVTRLEKERNRGYDVE